MEYRQSLVTPGGRPYRSALHIATDCVSADLRILQKGLKTEALLLVVSMDMQSEQAS